MGPALAALDTNLLDQLESELIGRIEGYGVDVSSWTDDTNTPPLVQTIIAKKYVSWLIDRQYSEDEDLNAYAARLDANAEALMLGISNGEILLPGEDEGGQPSFYPNDISSAQTPTADDPSLGPAKFSMGTIF